MMENIKSVFDKYGGVMSTSELRKEGFYYKKTKKLQEEGMIEQVRRGYYQYVGENSFSGSKKGIIRSTPCTYLTSSGPS